MLRLPGSIRLNLILVVLGGVLPVLGVVPYEKFAIDEEDSLTDRLAAGLYGIPCLLTLPRGADRSRGVAFRRRFEKRFYEKFYQKGGKVRG